MVNTPAKQSLYQLKQNMKTISKEELALIEQLFPDLRNKPHLRALYHWSARSYHWADKETGFPVMPRDLLASFLQAVGKYVNTEELLLKEYQEIVTEFRYRSHSIEGKLARVMTNSGLPELSEEVIYTNPRYQERVYLMTLRAFSRRSLEEDYRKLKKAAKEASHCLYVCQQKVIDYMNSLPLRTFLDLVDSENFDTVFKKAKEAGDKEAMQALQSIYTNPMPIYTTSSTEGSLTGRIFGDGLASAPKRIRHALLSANSGCMELDLQNCQLAIAAKVFGIDSLQKYLSKGESVWPMLMDYIGIPESKREMAKPFVKIAVYSLLYGKQKRYVEEKLTSDLEKIDLSTKRTLFSNNLMSDTALAITRIKKTIKKNRGMQGAEGWMPYEGGDIDSFISYLLQTIEMLIVSVCFDIALRQRKTGYNADFTIVLMQHDGLTIKFHEGANKELVMHRFQEAVSNMVSELGIYTLLVSEEPAQAPTPPFNLLYSCQTESALGPDEDWPEGCFEECNNPFFDEEQQKRAHTSGDYCEFCDTTDEEFEAIEAALVVPQKPIIVESVKVVEEYDAEYEWNELCRIFSEDAPNEE